MTDLPTLEIIGRSLRNSVTAKAIAEEGLVPSAVNVGQSGTDLNGDARTSYSEEYTVWAAHMGDKLWPVLAQQAPEVFEVFDQPGMAGDAALSSLEALLHSGNAASPSSNTSVREALFVPLSSALAAVSFEGAIEALELLGMPDNLVLLLGSSLTGARFAQSFCDPAELVPHAKGLKPEDPVSCIFAAALVEALRHALAEEDSTFDDSTDLTSPTKRRCAADAGDAANDEDDEDDEDAHPHVVLFPRGIVLLASARSCSEHSLQLRADVMFGAMEGLGLPAPDALDCVHWIARHEPNVTKAASLVRVPEGGVVQATGKWRDVVDAVRRSALGLGPYRRLAPSATPPPWGWGVGWVKQTAGDSAAAAALAPALAAGAALDHGFEVFPSFSVCGTPVTLARSKRTGLQLCLVQAEGPMVNLFGVVATEAVTVAGKYHRDDGLPHTLEHLVFLGSQQYPFKGVLDKLANRCLAEGTNAWTDVDHTAYTVSTAGSEGFLNLLPVYLDHILCPTITDAGFVTEVHHVNGEGQDKGVVYCEMQGRENSDGDLIERAVLNALYPDAQCGYASETGGSMQQLRSLTCAAVRSYHAEYYRPSNLMLIVTGAVGLDALLAAAGDSDRAYATAHPKGEAKGEAKDTNSEPPRPWLRPVAPMPAPPPWRRMFTVPEDEEDDEEDEEDDEEDEEDGAVDESAGVEVIREDTEGEREVARVELSHVELSHVGVAELEVPFPSEDESCGSVVLGWRLAEPFGPSLPLYKCSLDAAMRYLTESAASPVAKALVESAHAFASDVDFRIEVFKVGYLQLYVEGVDASRANDVLPTFLWVLQRTLAAGVDMERMAGVLAKRRRKFLAAMEDSPGDALVDPLIKHFLYHADPSPAAQVAALASATAALAHLDALSAYSAGDWAALLARQLLDTPLVCCRGTPSLALAAEIEAATAAREEATRAALGPAKLAKAAEAVAAAQAANGAAIPDAVLRSVPVPSAAHIPFFALASFRCTANASSVGPSPAVLRLGGTIRDDIGATGVDALHKALSAARASMGQLIPFDLQVDQVSSGFARLEVALSTAHLTRRQRLFLTLLDEVAFKLPTRDPNGPGGNASDGEQGEGDDEGEDAFGGELSHEETVLALERELCGYSCALGFYGGNFRSGSFGQHWKFSFKAERGQLPLLSSWARRIVFGSRLDGRRLRVACASLLASVPDEKRSANTMARAALDELLFTADANDVAMSPVRQQQFLGRLLKDLKAGGAAGHRVVAEAEAVRAALLAPLVNGLNGGRGWARARVRIAGDFLSPTYAGQASEAEAVLAAATAFLPADTLRAVAALSSENGDPGKPGKGTGYKEAATEAATVEESGDAGGPMGVAKGYHTVEGRSPSGRRGVVVGLASVENSAVVCASPGVGWGHRDEAALAVAVEYLTALEGDFWVQLRGAGLTYGYDLSLGRETGMLTFSLSRCSSPGPALARARAIVQGYCSGAALAETEFENAKSSLCSATLGAWESKSGALTDTFRAWFYLEAAGEAGGMAAGGATAEGYRRAFMARVDAVTVAEARAAMVAYVLPLFTRSVLACACPLQELAAVSADLGCAHPPAPDGATGRALHAAATLLSVGARHAGVVAVRERDLEALFPLEAAECEGDEEGEGEVWPSARLAALRPFWQRHQAACQAAAVTAVAIGAIVVIKLVRRK